MLSEGKKILHNKKKADYANAFQHVANISIYTHSCVLMLLTKIFDIREIIEREKSSEKTRRKKEGRKIACLLLYRTFMCRRHKSEKFVIKNFLAE